MKIYSFNICKCHVTIMIKKRKYEVVDKLEMKKDLVKSQPEEIKMEEKTSGEPMVDPNLILYNYCEKYIESQREILSESTLNGYKNIINNHLGCLMRTYLGDATNEDIQRSFDVEIEKGLSKKTLKGYKSFILKVLAVYRPDFTPEIRIEKESTDETT